MNHGVLMAQSVPDYRIRSVNSNDEDSDGRYVLYWMIAARRTSYNFGLQYAVERALALDLPLVVLEALRVDYEWASDRLHRFVIEGMQDNRDAFSDTKVSYYPYVEPKKGAGKGLLKALAKQSALVVTDDAPYFFLPKIIEAAGEQISQRLCAVDSNGIYPIHETERAFTTAASFRRHLQKVLQNYLGDAPKKNPFSRVELSRGTRIDGDILEKWPRSDLDALASDLGVLPIDHDVGYGGMKGGPIEAASRLKDFLGDTLSDYKEERNQPEARCQSFLSPYLHFGHLSSHQIFNDLMLQEDWDPSKIAPKATGSREGWWGASRAAEAFLDQFITWREVGYNGATHLKDHRKFKSLPDWAITTLEGHAGDEREHIYSLEQFESAQTHDELWNAAQRQLVAEGTIHNYLRMLWGKKILEWTKHPKDALDIMVHLNNKYAYDGRNPNSYSGIFWTLGRYDRAWGPEREIFGKIRFMSSKNTARKVNVKGYLKKYSSNLELF